MRIFAISDLHIDFAVNKEWLFSLSREDYTDDILLLAGDITHVDSLFKEGLTFLKRVFHQVVFVPGNHDLWVSSGSTINSLEKFENIIRFCDQIGVVTRPTVINTVRVIPLFAWYDYSFGEPSSILKRVWSDYQRCRWPEELSNEPLLTDYFLSLNNIKSDPSGELAITLSHFLPSLDLMPDYIPTSKRVVYPVLGTGKLARLIQAVQPDIHIYGHSHVNASSSVHRTMFINNAFGYPHEETICGKTLLEVFRS